MRQKSTFSKTNNHYHNWLFFFVNLFKRYASFLLSKYAGENHLIFLDASIEPSIDGSIFHQKNSRDGSFESLSQ